MYKAEKKTSTLLFLKLILNVIAKYILFKKDLNLRVRNSVNHG